MIAAVTASTLTLLKVGFLVLLYLFIFRAIRAVYLEISPKRNAPVVPTAPPVPISAAAPPGAGAPAAPAVSRRQARAESKAQTRVKATRLVVVAPAEVAGRSIPLDGDITFGRGQSVSTRLDDNFASTTHARVSQRDGEWIVEDLGSTNGTFVNDARIDGPTPLRKGDRLTVGKTVLEVRA